MEVDYPRVTHPFAGLLTLAGFLPRLACVRHAASVRSEPGSNSPINPGTTNADSKALRCPQSFMDLLSGFQRPSDRLLPTDDQLLPCPRRSGGSLGYCPLSKSPLLQGGGSCSTSVKTCQVSVPAGVKRADSGGNSRIRR